MKTLIRLLTLKKLMKIDEQENKFQHIIDIIEVNEKLDAIQR